MIHVDDDQATVSQRTPALLLYPFQQVNDHRKTESIQYLASDV